MIRQLVFVLLLVLFSASGFSEKVCLTNGDVLSGKILEKKKEVWVLDHEILGKISIPVDKIEEQNDQGQKVTHREQVTKVLSLGYDQKTGNTKSKSFSAQFNVHYKTIRQESELRLSFLYSSSDGEMDDRKAYLLGRKGYSFGGKDKWYWFAKAEISHDRFADIKARYLPSIGLGYWFFDGPAVRLMTEGSVGRQWTDFYSQKSSNQWTSVFRAYLLFDLWEGCSFLQDISLYPSLENLSDYRISSLSELSIPVTQGLALKFSLLEEYDSSPAQDKKKADTRVTSSLSWSF